MSFLRKCLYLAGAASLFLCLPPSAVVKADVVPVAQRDFYALAQLAEAQQVALAQRKPIGFLLTWPNYFPGAPDFHQSGSRATTLFYQGFKDQCVLINVNHANGELERVPKVARAAFYSPAEGGFAPCLCLVSPAFTKLIGIIPLWKTDEGRGESFAHFHTLIADKATWWDQPAGTPASTVVVPPGPAVGSAGPGGRPSSAFERELALTRQAEQQRSASSPSPHP